MEAKDGEVESPERRRVFKEMDNEEKEENTRSRPKKTSLDKMVEKEGLLEISSHEEEVEDDPVEFVKKRVKKDVEHRNTDENRSLIHRKKYQRKGLHKAKASNNGAPKASLF